MTVNIVVTANVKVIVTVRSVSKRTSRKRTEYILAEVGVRASVNIGVTNRVMITVRLRVTVRVMEMFRVRVKLRVRITTVRVMARGRSGFLEADIIIYLNV